MTNTINTFMNISDRSVRLHATTLNYQHERLTVVVPGLSSIYTTTLETSVRPESRSRNGRNERTLNNTDDMRVVEINTSIQSIETGTSGASQAIPSHFRTSRRSQSSEHDFDTRRFESTRNRLFESLAASFDAFEGTLDDFVDLCKLAALVHARDAMNQQIVNPISLPTDTPRMIRAAMALNPRSDSTETTLTRPPMRELVSQVIDLADEFLAIDQFRDELNTESRHSQRGETRPLLASE